ncbi:MAG TPA: hypothetical protein VFQ68_17455 [Streptosporangiaceae bacterium]|nr:hypothetical protein [Streptosporangiaceae bacterium]
MHAHIIAAADPTGSWQYATETWTKGGVVLGLVILLVIAAVGAFAKAR